MSADPIVADAATFRLKPRLAGLVAAGGAAAILLGSVLPWVGGADAGTVTYGLTTTADGIPALGSRLGLRGGDAIVTLIAGLLATLAAVPLVLGRSRRWHRLTLLTAGAVALSWTVLDIAEVGDTAGPDGARLDIGPGIGLLLALLGALALFAGAGLAPRDPLADLLAAADRIERRARRAVGRDEVEEQQRLLRRGARTVGEDHPELLWLWVTLAEMYAAMGDRARGMQAVNQFVERSDRVFADDPEQRLARRVGATIAYGTIDPIATVPFAEGVLREVGHTFGKDHQLTQLAWQTRDRLRAGAHPWRP